MKSARLRRFQRVVLFLFAGLAVLVAGTWFLYTHRPRPGDTQKVIFEGVTYIRDVRDDPRPLIIHVVSVELAAPGIGFLVTPGDPAQDMPLRARKTSEFLDEFGLQVAVNGDFFTPWYSHAPWSYYPHVGDPVEVRGLAVSEGSLYSRNPLGQPSLILSHENQARIDRSAGFGQDGGHIFNAISGDTILVQDGAIPRRLARSAFRGQLHPRTAIALDRDATHLLLVVVDGRQPNYSEGVSLSELARIMIEYGAHYAINLDGGGSSTLVVEGPSGRPRILNSPIDNRIPGRERPVANHLGVFARRPVAGQSN